MAQLSTLGVVVITFMKRIIIIFGIFALATGLVFARRMAWPDTQPPRLALPDAYAAATNALGATTNQFYCVGAGTLISRSPDGEWLFTFCSTNGAYKSVFVFFDKQTRVEDGVPSF
jgi:hypothetical protein